MKSVVEAKNENMAELEESEARESSEWHDLCPSLRISKRKLPLELRGMLDGLESGSSSR